MSENQRYQGLPLPGYKPQSQENMDLVTEGKQIEERVLRYLDKLMSRDETDYRFCAMGRSDIQKGFMLAFRSIMQPTRCSLPEDGPATAAIPGEVYRGTP